MINYIRELVRGKRGSRATSLSKAQLPAVTVYTDTASTFTAAQVIQHDGGLTVKSTDGTGYGSLIAPPSAPDQITATVTNGFVIANTANTNFAAIRATGVPELTVDGHFIIKRDGGLTVKNNDASGYGTIIAVSGAPDQLVATVDNGFVIANTANTNFAAIRATGLPELTVDGKLIVKRDGGLEIKNSAATANGRLKAHSADALKAVGAFVISNSAETVEVGLRGTAAAELTVDGKVIILRDGGLEIKNGAGSNSVAITATGTNTIAVAGSVDFAKNQTNNFRFENRTSDISSPVEGLAYWDTSADTLNVYNGSTWSSIGSGGGGITGTLTSGRVPFASGTSTLTDDADLTFSGDTLTATKVNHTIAVFPDQGVDPSNAEELLNNSGNLAWNDGIDVKYLLRSDYSGFAGPVMFSTGGAKVASSQKLSFIDSANNGLQLNNNGSSVTLTVSAGSPSSGTSGFYFTQNLANSGSIEIGSITEVTAHSSATGGQIAQQVKLSGTYTGSDVAAVTYVESNSTGTGTSLAGGVGNFGVYAVTIPSTTGSVAPIFGWAQNSGNGKRVGVYGYVTANGGSAKGIGVAGVSTDSAGTNVGGWFGFTSAADPNPTVSAALIADNGSTSRKILSLGNDGNEVFSVEYQGKVISKTDLGVEFKNFTGDSFALNRGLVVVTTDSTQTELSIDGADTKYLTLAAGTAHSYIIHGTSWDSTNGDMVTWEITAAAKRVGSTTSLVGTPSVTKLYNSAGASTWSISVTADDTNDRLAVKFTGEDGVTVRTVLHVKEIVV